MRKWLQALVDEYLPSVEQLRDTPEDLALAKEWATWMRQKWAEHGMTALKQQRNLMTDVRKAIKTQLGENHRALESMNFTMAEWTLINSPIDEQVARRNENVMLLHHPDAIVAQAVRLLESREWAEVAAGLVVLTGRRSSEILGTASFQPKSQWSVTFIGALKRRQEVQMLSFEIPTLTTAERVISALTKLRQMCPTQELSVQQINQKYAQAVATACDRYFSDLVPHRNGRSKLFTHLFRSVYAAIASFWYAPPTVDASEYKAAIQGHYAFQGEGDSPLKRSLTASRHYNDYKIGDRAGNIDGRQGIKLGHGGVEVIEAFDKPQQAITLPPKAIPSEVNGQANDLEIPVMSATQEVSQQSIESVFEVLDALPETEKKGQPENPKKSKQRQPRRIKSILVDLELLRTVTGRFGIEIRGGKGQGYDHALTELLLGLERGTIALNDALHSLEPTPPLSQTVVDQARTLAWLIGRVEGLEAEIMQLQPGKQAAQCLADAAKVAPTLSQENEPLLNEINQLKDENNHLKIELLQTQSRLEGIQRFLSEGTIAPPKTGTGTAIEIAIPEDSTKHQSLSAPILPVPQKVSAASSRPDLDADVLHALNAILNYNEYEAADHHQRWAISVPVMKDLLKQVGKATQPKIEAVLRAKSEAIAQHHRHHGLGERHNRVHHGQSISDVIRL
ncbi:MAG: hypothetical protein HC781_13865 [Leptolyngbyaceae cyanobacterium CSU_1_4]|nr:hypothetical protein [Leptolyngbyaceae cyanobacterium CSU_1_4]